MGGRLKLARKDRGLTGEKLSEICNINAVYLREIEAGKKMPSLPVFISLCRALKVSPAYLLADLLPDTEIRNMDYLLELWQTATPSQLKIISSMLQAALESLKEE